MLSHHLRYLNGKKKQIIRVKQIKKRSLVLPGPQTKRTLGYFAGGNSLNTAFATESPASSINWFS